MKIKKRTFDLIFIVLTTVLLVLLAQYGLLEKYVGFVIIPIISAYWLGQYAERKFKN